ncbi:MAG: TerB family tellurite resistance protein [Cellvibrionales bacterium]|nr:TerB family tellurite resistance protein [Cellvibrionales bacterium]
MLKAIKAFFDAHIVQEEAAKEDADQIAVAALLVEVMLSDGSISPPEEASLNTFLQAFLKLPDAQVTTLIELAKSASHDAQDLYQFTRLINDHFDYEKRCKLIQGLWGIAYADHHLDQYEEHRIRKISDLLYIRHSDFVKAKIAANPQATNQQKKP